MILTHGSTLVTQISDVDMVMMPQLVDVHLEAFPSILNK